MSTYFRNWQAAFIIMKIYTKLTDVYIVAFDFLIIFLSLSFVFYICIRDL